ncbi:hypothetical protein C8035_v006249 [Colletotrichum spinosum]|uniref:Uncharacterized protein n=1 Tax=Colletotrichum spinosum TaxID=1347390 RepID=A0A4R8Q4F5_9PEZI|nr:hypothetical protein C8035_v006249 [Colletotrichum spinosum]
MASSALGNAAVVLFVFAMWAIVIAARRSSIVNMDLPGVSLENHASQTDQQDAEVKIVGRSFVGGYAARAAAWEAL